MKRSVLVVGGAGYIGSHTAKLLLAKGYQPVILDDLSTGHREAARRATKDGPFYLGSYTDSVLVEKILTDHHIHTVMHFAAKALVEESVKNPFLYYSTNVAGTLELLETMHKASVKNFIFSSTCATFGQHENSIDEQTPQNPVNPYGRSKLFVECILKDMERAHGLRSGILRYFNAAGADFDKELGEDHTPETHLIPNALKIALNASPDSKQKMTVFGTDYPTPDGSCIRDYIHVNDLAEAHIKMMELITATQKSCDVNLGVGQGYSVLEIIKTVSEVTEKDVPFVIGPRRAGDPPRLVANPQKAREILNWRAETGLEAIVKSAFEWVKLHPTGYKSE
jgi:UDP-glucose 4-epimerase